MRLNPFGNQVSFDLEEFQKEKQAAETGLNPFGNQVSFDKADMG